MDFEIWQTWIQVPALLVYLIIKFLCPWCEPQVPFLFDHKDSRLYVKLLLRELEVIHVNTSTAPIVVLNSCQPEVLW